MANIADLIANRNQELEDFKQKKQEERTEAYERRDAAVMEVTSDPEKYRAFLDVYKRQAIGGPHGRSHRQRDESVQTHSGKHNCESACVPYCFLPSPAVPSPDQEHTGAMSQNEGYALHHLPHPRAVYGTYRILLPNPAS